MAEQYISKARNPSKREHMAILLKRVKDALDAGVPPEEAISEPVLTRDQYDALIDYGVDLDELILSPEQQKTISELMTKAVGRPKFPAGYDKQYPPAKREFFRKLTEFIIAEGGEIRPRPKCNYRNIEFDLGGKYYEIVFSFPPKKQGK